MAKIELSSKSNFRERKREMVEKNNLSIKGASGRPSFSLPAQTAVADSTTDRTNPIRILYGFNYVLPISAEIHKN